MQTPPTDSTDYADLVEFLATGGRVPEARSWSRQPAATATPSWADRAKDAASTLVDQAAQTSRRGS